MSTCIYVPAGSLWAKISGRLLRARLLRYAMRALIVLALFLSSTPAWAGEPISIAGPARAIDGDTLWVGETQVRLQGIDAPELDQTCRTRKGRSQNCGKMARQALARLVLRQRVSCKGGARDRDGRLIAVCRLGPFRINEQMVMDGWALAHGDGGAAFIRAQSFAKARREGIWRSTFVMPWEWREGMR